VSVERRGAVAQPLESAGEVRRHALHLGAPQLIHHHDQRELGRLGERGLRQQANY
jgi:hypothetical protein